MLGWKWPAVLAGTLLFAGALRAQTARPSPAPASASAVDQVVDRIIQQENRLMARVNRYTPLVEIYVQNTKPNHQLGPVPVHDYYYLGKADLARGMVFQPLDLKTGGFVQTLAKPFKDLFSSSYDPDGFLQMIYPDRRGLDRAHYTFRYVRREFLGEVRCLVFDVVPKPESGQGRFKGRIWVEDRHFTIVRFNGVFAPAPRLGMYFHFDSWRINVAPGVWLPAYVYSQENGQKGLLRGGVRFRAQMRLWAYNLSPAAREEALSRILVESSGSSQPIQDQSQANSDLSPVQAERAFEDQAAQNVLDRLQSLGLLAPPGPVDQVLDTVVNNLEVSNNLNLQPAVHCRVLLTTPLEAFAVGHTIVLSRGLIDVLPDEPSLATMLAQELAEILLGHSIETKYAFSDRMIFNVKNTFHVLDFHESRKSEAEASAKAVELLKNSPYRSSLAKAGLFLKALQAESKDLRQLISPHLGNRPQEIQAIEQLGPQLQPTNVKQIAALPLGSRIKVSPWNDQIRMMQTQPVALLYAREKMPFELAPFYLHLERVKGTSAGLSQTKPGGGNKP
jgi:hypothetical protein